MSIAVATPCYAGLTTKEFTQSMLALAASGTISHCLIVEDSLITRARDRLVFEFLKTDCDTLLFIDADIGFNPALVREFVESGRHIIAADYRIKRDEPQSWVGVLAPSGHGTEYFKASYVGTGFLMIHREVFEAIERNGIPSYRLDSGERCLQYFRSSIDEASGSLLSEDYHFSKLARDAGYEIWLKRDAGLRHVGKKVYE